MQINAFIIKRKKRRVIMKKVFFKKTSVTAAVLIISMLLSFGIAHGALASPGKRGKAGRYAEIKRRTGLRLCGLTHGIRSLQ